MSQSRYLVRRRNWRWAPGNEHTPRGWVCFPGPGTAVAEFDFFDDAEHDWGKREAAVRLKMNPFECGPLPALSSLPEPIFRDFLMDSGIVLPEAGVPWDAWWSANRDQLSDEQTARVWEAVGKVRFFEITEEAVGPEVHVVVDVVWEEREGIHVAECDGGELIRACRHVQRAGEIARGRANQQRIVMTDSEGVVGPFANCRPCNVPDPFTPGSTRLMRLPQVPFCDVQTIPFDETDAGLLPRPHRVAVVVRLDYAPWAHGFRYASEDAGVGVKAFADWGEAEGHAIDLERDARASVNPFRLGSRPETLVFHTPPVRLPEMARAMDIPITRSNDWAAWWAEQIAPLPSSKRDQFWDLLALRFYTVLSVGFEG